MVGLFEKARKANLPKIVTGTVQLNEKGTEGTCSSCPTCRSSFRLFIKASLWRYKCDACGKSGDAIDYISVDSGLPSKDAALKILEMQPELSWAKAKIVDKEVQRKALHEVCRRIFVNGHTSVKEVLDWGFEKFGLKREDFTNLALDGRLKMLPFGMMEAMNKLQEWGVEQPLMAQAGLWKDGKRCPAIAFRQIMLPSRDRRAVEFISIDESSHQLAYGDFTSPIVMCDNQFNPEVFLVDNGIDGLKFIGEGHINTVWNAPSGSWRQSWFWEQFQANPKTVFNLSRLPKATAAECAAKLQAKQIPFK